ncbi:Uncharacterized protein QTN25_008653 [Entamoeba marina]
MEQSSNNFFTKINEVIAQAVETVLLLLIKYQDSNTAPPEKLLKSIQEVSKSAQTLTDVSEKYTTEEFQDYPDIFKEIQDCLVKLKKSIQLFHTSEEHFKNNNTLQEGYSSLLQATRLLGMNTICLFRIVFNAAFKRILAEKNAAQEILRAVNVLDGDAQNDISTGCTQACQAAEYLRDVGDSTRAKEASQIIADQIESKANDLINNYNKYHLYGTDDLKDKLLDDVDDLLKELDKIDLVMRVAAPDYEEQPQKIIECGIKLIELLDHCAISSFNQEASKFHSTLPQLLANGREFIELVAVSDLSNFLKDVVKAMNLCLDFKDQRNSMVAAHSKFRDEVVKLLLFSSCPEHRIPPMPQFEEMIEISHIQPLYLVLDRLRNDLDNNDLHDFISGMRSLSENAPILIEEIKKNAIESNNPTKIELAKDIDDSLIKLLDEGKSYIQNPNDDNTKTNCRDIINSLMKKLLDLANVNGVDTEDALAFFSQISRNDEAIEIGKQLMNDLIDLDKNIRNKNSKKSVASVKKVAENQPKFINSQNTTPLTKQLETHLRPLIVQCSDAIKNFDQIPLARKEIQEHIEIVEEILRSNGANENEIPTIPDVNTQNGEDLQKAFNNVIDALDNVDEQLHNGDSTYLEDAVLVFDDAHDRLCDELDDKQQRLLTQSHENLHSALSDYENDPTDINKLKAVETAIKEYIAASEEKKIAKLCNRLRKAARNRDSPQVTHVAKKLVGAVQELGRELSNGNDEQKTLAPLLNKKVIEVLQSSKDLLAAKTSLEAFEITLDELEALLEGTWTVALSLREIAKKALRKGKKIIRDYDANKKVEALMPGFVTICRDLCNALKSYTKWVVYKQMLADLEEEIVNIISKIADGEVKLVNGKDAHDALAKAINDINVNNADDIESAIDLLGILADDIILDANDEIALLLNDLNDLQNKREAALLAGDEEEAAFLLNKINEKTKKLSQLLSHLKGDKFDKKVAKDCVDYINSIANNSELDPHEASVQTNELLSLTNALTVKDSIIQASISGERLTELLHLVRRDDTLQNYRKLQNALGKIEELGPLYIQQILNICDIDPQDQRVPQIHNEIGSLTKYLTLLSEQGKALINDTVDNTSFKQTALDCIDCIDQISKLLSLDLTYICYDAIVSLRSLRMYFHHDPTKAQSTYSHYKDIYAKYQTLIVPILQSDSNLDVIVLSDGHQRITSLITSFEKIVASLLESVAIHKIDMLDANALNTCSGYQQIRETVDIHHKTKFPLSVRMLYLAQLRNIAILQKWLDANKIIQQLTTGINQLNPTTQNAITSQKKAIELCNKIQINCDEKILGNEMRINLNELEILLIDFDQLEHSQHSLEVELKKHFSRVNPSKSHKKGLLSLSGQSKKLAENLQKLKDLARLEARENLQNLSDLARKNLELDELLDSFALDEQQGNEVDYQSLIGDYESDSLQSNLCQVAQQIDNAQKNVKIEDQSAAEVCQNIAQSFVNLSKFTKSGDKENIILEGKRINLLIKEFCKQLKNTVATCQDYRTSERLEKDYVVLHNLSTQLKILCNVKAANIQADDLNNSADDEQLISMSKSIGKALSDGIAAISVSEQTNRKKKSFK